MHLKFFPTVLFIIISLIMNVKHEAYAQDNLGGSVKYQKIKRFNFGERDNPRWKDFVASLPKEGKYAYVLHFTKDFAIYTNNPEEQEASSPELQRALHFQNMTSTPKPEINKVFQDFNKKQKVEQVDFMTRTFFVESDIQEINWKLINKPKKILGYICMGAETTIGENLLRVWFTSDIPISAGPENLHGLPGLILLTEVNGEMSIVATSINLEAPDQESFKELAGVKALTKEEFDKIVEEKLEEHKKNSTNRGRFH